MITISNRLYLDLIYQAGLAMGVDYTLACDSCKEFLNLHKWPIVEQAGEALEEAYSRRGGSSDLHDQFQWLGFGKSYKKIVLTSSDLSKALEVEVPDQPYIHELTPLVRQFASTHKRHLIFLSCDLGYPEPWGEEQAGFDEWLELPGPFHFHHYLPRNLIGRGYQTWGEVLVHMKKEYPFEYAEFKECSDLIELIRIAFERRLLA